MELTYLKNNRRIITDSDENEDFSLQILKNGNRVKITIHPKTEITLKQARIVLPYCYQEDDLIYLNGFQSWTDTREFSVHERMKGLNHLPGFLKEKYHFSGYGDYDFTRYDSSSLHGFTYSYIRRGEEALFVGSYNFRNAYLVIYHMPKDERMVLESDVRDLILDRDFVLFDYVVLQGKKDEVLSDYLSSFSCSAKQKIRGYTSWYNHYQDINEGLLERNLEGIGNDSYDLFQIDDGFEPYVGDWLKEDAKKFPNGLLPLVEKVHQKKLKAGIWLAPFVAEKDSALYQEHPEYFYQEEGKPVYCGCNWSGQLVLDFRKDCVKDYLRKVFEKYISLGFDLFKLDFLYAVTRIKDEHKTRCMLMEEAMEFLRDILKDKWILGCGVPLCNAFGNVDYCRIGPDVSLVFDDVFYMRLMHRERISTKVTLLNTIYRQHLNGHVFLNDPDVYLLRDDNISLSKEQKRALLLINHLCGSVLFTSDNVKEYDDGKRKMLEEARTLGDAKLVDVITLKNKVKLIYLLHGEKKEFVYDTKKGLIVNG